ncbi:glutathione S-transferase T3-like protein [Tanacetum coccineum]
MGGSSSQPRTDPPRSPINAFLIEELYTPEFSESLQENTAYWQEPNTYEAAGERVATSPTKKNKATCNRQKIVIQTDDAPRQNAWTTEEEIALAKESKTKQEGRRTYDMVVEKWKTVCPTVVRFCEVYGNVMHMAQESGAGDEDYVQRPMIHYQDETGVPFKFRHCLDVLKDSLKFQEIVFPNFNQGSEGSSKRHKSSGSSSFNTESRDASINLYTTVADEDEVQEIRRPGGRDKARTAAKNKGSKALGSSTMNDDALARLMVNEMTYAEVQQHEAFMELKRREVECREREIAATEYRGQQEDIKLYLQPYDHLIGEHRLAMDEIRAKIKAKYNLQYDSWRWNLIEDGNFKIKDLAFMVDDICLHVGNTTQETLWNKLAPKKVNVFIWRVLHGRIPVRVELDKRGIELDSILCPCCDDSVESCDHSLVTCNVAKGVWDKIFEWWKIGPINVFSANDLFRFSGNVDVESCLRALWQLVIWQPGISFGKSIILAFSKQKWLVLIKFFLKFKLRALTGFRGDQKMLPSTGRNGSSIPQAAKLSDGIAKLYDNVSSSLA